MILLHYMFRFSNHNVFCMHITLQNSNDDFPQIALLYIQKECIYIGTYNKYIYNISIQIKYYISFESIHNFLISHRY